jgi:phenylalanine-4-hydroxylase
MDDKKTIIEYGVEVDPATMIAPDDPDTLVLEPGHPGEHDRAYVERREMLFALSRRHRLQHLPPPVIEYTDEERRIWREVYASLDALHRRLASRIYLEAKRTLGITADDIPQLRDLSEQLTAETGMHLVPAEGPLAYRFFYASIAEKGFPVTQFLRHGSHPEFTPEPDMIHDCLGHVPPLMDHDYAGLMTTIARAAVRTTSGEHLLALKRLSWFSIEFGLIEEAGETRVFGAGLLSSTGEMPFSLSNDVTRRPFATDEVVATDYDPSRMQERLFVIPSFAFLRDEVEAFVKRLGIDVTAPVPPAQG